MNSKHFVIINENQTIETMETCYTDEDSIFENDTYEDHETEYDLDDGNYDTNFHDESIMLFFNMLLILKDKYYNFSSILWYLSF